MSDDMVGRTANLLGAAALVLNDRMLSAATAAAGVSASGSAALVTLATDPGVGVTELGERVGLSQPAAARMVDSLATRGLVERRPGVNGRAVAVHPTEQGRLVAGRVLRARIGELSRFVDHLEGDERAALTRGLEKLLERVLDDAGSEYVVCRLCDRGACTAEGARCPVGQAARERGNGGHER